MDKRYINVVGGPIGCADLQQVSLELTRAGFTGLDILPGPLIRASQGAAKGFSHMPLNPNSTYQNLHRAFDVAYQEANTGTPDPELDLAGAISPLWGHHSNRRGGDTAARQTRAQSGASEEDIDLIFGWNEAMYSAQMQHHYESKFVREVRCRVTQFL